MYTFPEKGGVKNSFFHTPFLFKKAKPDVFLMFLGNTDKLKIKIILAEVWDFLSRLDENVFFVRSVFFRKIIFISSLSGVSFIIQVYCRRY